MRWNEREKEGTKDRKWNRMREISRQRDEYIDGAENNEREIEIYR